MRKRRVTVGVLIVISYRFAITSCDLKAQSAAAVNSSIKIMLATANGNRFDGKELGWY
jgi:hypothetical protein